MADGIVDPHCLQAMMRAVAGWKAWCPPRGYRRSASCSSSEGKAEQRGAIAGPSVRSDLAAHAIAALMGESLSVKQLEKGT